DRQGPEQVVLVAQLPLGEDGQRRRRRADAGEAGVAGDLEELARAPVRRRDQLGLAVPLLALGFGGALLRRGHSSTLSTARNASCGISTDPTDFIRFLPSFCFSRSFRLREMSPP